MSHDLIASIVWDGHASEPWKEMEEHFWLYAQGNTEKLEWEGPQL